MQHTTQGTYLHIKGGGSSFSKEMNSIFGFKMKFDFKGIYISFLSH